MEIKYKENILQTAREKNSHYTQGNKELNVDRLLNRIGCHKTMGNSLNAKIIKVNQEYSTEIIL